MDGESWGDMLNRIRSDNKDINKTGKCNWCKGDKRTYWEHDPDGEGCFLHVKSIPSELTIYSPVQCSNFEMHVPIKFCPMCGRKL